MNRYVIAACFGLLCAVVGFFIGRSSNTEVEKTVIVKEPAVRGIITGLVPVSETTPSVSVLPVVRDTVYIDNVRYIKERVDTAAIIADYEIRRRYEVPLFDNQYGKLNVTWNTQYNRSDSIAYTFVPIRTIQYVRVRKTFEPFIGVSYSSFGYISGGVGLFYHNLGIEASYQRSLYNSDYGFLIGLKWKF